MKKTTNYNKMKFLPYIIGFILLANAFACQRETTYPLAMQQAESLMNTRPDSAIYLLQDMADSISVLPEEAQMYYHLLTIQAKDKQYITHTSDSLINRIVSFYEEYNDNDRLMMAYFYQGSTYRDMNDAPRALKAFHQAIDAGKETENLTLLGQTYGQMGTLFSYQDLYDEALTSTKKALSIYTLQKDSNRYSYLNRDIARIFNAQGKRDSALLYYQRAFGLGITNSYQKNNILSEIGCLYYYKGELEKAKSILIKVLSELPNADNALLFLGLIYKKEELLDSANYYANKTLLYGDISKKRSAYKLLAEIEDGKRNTLIANTYRSRYFELQDSINNHTRTKVIEKLHLLYNFQKVEKEKNLLSLKNQQKQSLINLLCLVSFICVATILFLTYCYKKKKKEAEDQRIRLEQILNDPKTEIENHKKNEQTQSDVYRQLHQVLHEGAKLTEEDWLQIKESIDKIFPELTFRICMLYPKITQHQLRICYLVKLKFTNDNIAKLLYSTPASVSVARKRLYEKITGKIGKPEDFNSLISDL